MNRNVIFYCSTTSDRMVAVKRWSQQQGRGAVQLLSDARSQKKFEFRL